MRIIKINPSSKCKDGSLVKEYSLISPVVGTDITTLKDHGEVILKDIGGNQLFTFSSNGITIKGMVGDTVIFVTHKKEDLDIVDRFMNLIFG